MIKKASFILIILLLLAVIFGCDFYKLPISDFIANATGTANADDYSFLTSCHIRDTDIAIPPNENAIITVKLDNPQEYDLLLTLEDEGSHPAGAFEKVSLQLQNKQEVLVTITNPERGEVFDLTIRISANNRKMPSYKLPRMETRFINADIESITITPLYGPLRDIQQTVNIPPPPHGG